jgi:PleD family two-component response regulator
MRSRPSRPPSPEAFSPSRMNAGLFLPRPAAIGSKKTISIEGVQCGTEGVQCGTKLSNNCLLLMFILTVEDDFLISEYLRAILEVGGHRVIATFEADEAIEVLERVRDIQLVITDISMPGSMDGSD